MADYPDIWSASTSAYWSAVKLTLAFSLFGVLILDSMGYVLHTDLWPSDLQRLTWGTDLLKDAINRLQSGVTINILVAIPQFLLAIAAILVQLLVNAILLLNWLLSKFLSLVFILVVMDAEGSAALASILAWIIEAPVILGAAMAIGRAIWTFISGGGGG